MKNGYHGEKEEKKTPGFMFDVVNNSRYGWVPYGVIYHSCKIIWKDTLTEHMFWNMILHTKNDNEGYNSYMIKYWPGINM
eukprot:7125393-Heterocapsa_arctica.AAC.1